MSTRVADIDTESKRVVSLIRNYIVLTGVSHASSYPPSAVHTIEKLIARNKRLQWRHVHAVLLNVSIAFAALSLPPYVV